jgi:hypothetical protein
VAAISFYQIELPRTQLKAMARKAKLVGKAAPEYVRLLIEQDLLADKSFDEILRPIRQDFLKSGTTESQLDTMVRRARHRPRRKKCPPSQRVAGELPRRRRGRSGQSKGI